MTDAGVFTLTIKDGVKGLKAGQVLIHRSLFQKTAATIFHFSSVQFSSVAQSCPTLCDPMKRSMPGLPVHHQLLEFTQTHIH